MTSCLESICSTADLQLLQVPKQLFDISSSEQCFKTFFVGWVEIPNLNLLVCVHFDELPNVN